MYRNFRVTNYFKYITTFFSKFNYLNNQLKKRIEINNYSGSIDVSIINNEIYIENTDEFKEIKNELKTSLFTNYKINENSAKNILGIISSSSSDVIIKENKMEK